MQGSPFAFVAIGILSGWLYVRGVVEGSLRARMGLAFLYTYILISPMHSALSMGNGLLMLANLVIASMVLTPWFSAHEEPVTNGSTFAPNQRPQSTDG